MRAHDPGYAETPERDAKRSAESNIRRRGLHGTKVTRARLLLLTLAVSVLGVFAPQPAGAAPGDPSCASGETLNVFTFTLVPNLGGDQPFQTSPGATSMQVRTWGASASGSNNTVPDPDMVQGPGAYAQADYVVTGGTDYVVMVGESRKKSAGLTYGFGHSGTSAASGGGLSGVFTGTAPVLATDSARAIIVAGGGGGNDIYPGGDFQIGYPGGDVATAGGNAGSMAGLNGNKTFFPATGTNHSGGGGGGYEGGGVHQDQTPGSTFATGGRGGTSFASGANPVFASVAVGAVGAPNTADPYYIAPAADSISPDNNQDGGDGLVVILECSGPVAPADSDGDGILDTDELPGQVNDPCVDTAHADWVELPTNDCDGDGVTADIDVDDYDMCVDDGGPTGVCTPTATAMVCGVVVVFETTEADQAFVVPANVANFLVRAWGAAGGFNDAVDRDQNVSGAGAYVEAQVDVAAAGSSFVVVVGEAGGATNSGNAYGFGGTTEAAGGGGGLSGLFSGAGPVVATDTARAILVAGGGGGSDYATPLAALHDEPGSNGGDPVRSGGMPTMEGFNGGATALAVGVNEAGGGGGYSGGIQHVELYGGVAAGNRGHGGYGGSSFMDAAMIVAGSDKNIWTTSWNPTAPHQTDPNYVAGIAAGGDVKGDLPGDGLVVIEYIVDADNDGIGEWTGTGPAPAGCDTPAAVDSDGDGILDTDEIPGQENDPCLDPTHADWMQLPTNDCDGDGSTVGDGDTDDADPCAAPGDTNWVELATNDCDSDGSTVGDGDTTDTDPCLDPTFANWVALATNDCDGDGSTVGDGDMDDMDPCADPTFTNWVALATNDCDGDGVTVGAGDMDDFDVCIDAAGALASCVDTDGDGVTDDVDTDPADPCVDPADAGWIQQATNDCDNDGTTVGGGDSVDTDPCVDFTLAPASNDCDNDGVTVGAGDMDDMDPCVDSTGKICYEITGQVWFDANQDGVRDVAETDISGVTVELRQGGVVVQTAVTASPYLFTDLAPGTYDVFVDVNTLPAWLTITFDADTNLDHIMTVTITDDDIVLVDFGYAPQSLEGQLLFDGSPVANQTITIVDAAGNTFTVMTDAAGMYELEGSLMTSFYPGSATVSAVVNGQQLSETVQVLGATVNNQDLAAGSPTAPAELAFTGSNSTTLAQIGFVLVLTGFGLVAMSGRREEDALLLEV